ncbi:MAG TPA: phosphatase domain-containing protein, partial [Caldilineaceae bacterium]|nr:phosphatase domain-containing protein [Caldilineaceae bacterium]
MSKLSSLVARIGYRLDDRLDLLREQLRRRLGYTYSPLQIVPYRTYGTASSFFLAGRVLENRARSEPPDDDELWDNLLAMYRRFASREVKGVRLRAAYAGSEAHAASDAEGYFQMDLHLPAPLVEEAGWITVDMTAENAADFGQELVQTQAEVLIPPAQARFGVISDIDDTVVVTHATNLLKMARMVFLHSARTRLPFPGVAAFYQALHRGRTGDERNPLFFVSSSAWNLYDLLVDFMALNDIPPAPLLLTDYGANESGFLFSGHRTHKLEQIGRILSTYPTLPFILIGDSGQKDPEIYHQVAQDHPGRILAIYIRDVSQPSRHAEIEHIRNALGAGAKPVEMLLEADT